MTYIELISQLKKLPLEEVRNNSNQFFEFVIQVKELGGLHALLEAYFGSPLKPAGKNPSKEMDRSVSGYGGIRADQTLYQLEDDKNSHYAMLWPWANGALVTVKIVQTARRS